MVPLLDGSVVGLFRGKTHNCKPEGAYGVDHLHVFIEIGWLRDEAVRVLVVGGSNIFRILRRRHDHYGNTSEGGIGLDFGQDFVATFFREIEIEKDDPRSAGIFIGWLCPDVGKGSFPICNDTKIVWNLPLFENFDHELDVCLIVLDEKDVDYGVVLRRGLIGSGHYLRMHAVGTSRIQGFSISCAPRADGWEILNIRAEAKAAIP